MKKKATLQKKKHYKHTDTSDAYMYWRFLHYDSNVNYATSISSTYLTNPQSYGYGTYWYNPSCAGLSNGNFVMTGMWYSGGYWYAGTFILNKYGGIVKTWFRGDQGNLYGYNNYYSRVGSIPVSPGGFLVHWSWQGSYPYMGRSFDDNGNALTSDNYLYTYGSGGNPGGVCGISLGGYLVKRLFFFCIFYFFLCVFVFLCLALFFFALFVSLFEKTHTHKIQKIKMKGYISIIYKSLLGSNDVI